METQRLLQNSLILLQGGWSILDMALIYGETERRERRGRWGLSVVVVAGEELLQTIHCGQKV